VWYTPVILALSRLRKEDLKFKASLGYTMTQKIRNKNKQKPKLQRFNLMVQERGLAA
jgi:hypothetical protein